MLNRVVITFSFSVLVLNLFSQDQPRTIENHAFKCGEELVYRIHYGFIDAGVAKLKIDNKTTAINGKPAYHAVGTGVSAGLVDLVFKVNDRYESYIDSQTVAPVMFIRRVDEGGFKIKQNQLYDQPFHKVNSDGKVMKVPDYVQDMVSAFYYSRTFDYTDIKPGKIDSVVTFVDNEVWSLKIKFDRRDTIDSDLGKICCLVFEPIVQKGRIFKHSDDLQVWISDDKNHIPIRAQANILVGSLKLDIMSASGLPNDIAKAK